MPCKPQPAARHLLGCLTHTHRQSTAQILTAQSKPSLGAALFFDSSLEEWPWEIKRTMEHPVVPKNEAVLQMGRGKSEGFGTNLKGAQQAARSLKQPKHVHHLEDRRRSSGSSHSTTCLSGKNKTTSAHNREPQSREFSMCSTLLCGNNSRKCSDPQCQQADWGLLRRECRNNGPQGT